MRRSSLLPFVFCFGLVACSSDSPPSQGETEMSGGTGGAAFMMGGAGASAANDASSNSSQGGAGGNERGDASSTMSEATTNAEAAAPPPFAYVYVSGYGPTIATLTLDMSTGKLGNKSSVMASKSSPSYLAFSPDKQFLYAINEADGANSIVLAFKIDKATGAITSINNAPTQGSGAPHLMVHPSGKVVVVAHYNSGDVSTIGIDANGGVTSPPLDIQHPADAKSHQAVSDSSGRFVFVPNVDANSVFRFGIDVATGKLSSLGSVTGFPEGAGPRHMAFHPTEKWAFTINETADTVSSLRYDAASGALATPVTVDSLPAGASHTGATGAHIIVHPSGKFVFSSNRGHNSISVFAVGADAKLTQTSNQTGGGTIKTPRDFGMDPTGNFLVVANQDGASLTVFRINQSDGSLTKTDDHPSITMPTFVGIVFL